MGLTSRSVDCYVIRVSNINQIFIPHPWMLQIITSQKLNQYDVPYLYLTVVYGLKSIDLFNLVKIFSQSVVEGELRNLVSLFKMMLLGIPKCTQTFSNNICVAYCLLVVFFKGMRMHILLNMSTTTN